MKSALRCRFRKGATYLEYALLAALIGIVGAVGVEGQSTAGFHQQLVSNVFTDVSLEIPAAALSRSNACFTVRGRFVSCGYWLFQ